MAVEAYPSTKRSKAYKNRTTETGKGMKKVQALRLAPVFIPRSCRREICSMCREIFMGNCRFA